MFYFAVCDKVLYARMKLLIFTLGKRRVRSLTRKQRIVGIGPRRSVGKVFPRGCHLFTLGFPNESFEPYWLQFPFLMLQYATRDIRTVRSSHSSCHEKAYKLQAISVLSIFFTMLFLVASFFDFSEFLFYRRANVFNLFNSFYLHIVQYDI